MGEPPSSRGDQEKVIEFRVAVPGTTCTSTGVGKEIVENTLTLLFAPANVHSIPS
jgi:hypothetical protein